MNLSFFDQTFQKNHHNANQKPTGRVDLLYTSIVFWGIFFYPFLIVGIPLVLYFRHKDRKEYREHLGQLDYESFFTRHFSTFVLAAIITFVLNAMLFLFVIPEAYLSCYLLFPFNLFPTTLHFSFVSLLALLLGAVGQAFILLCVNAFIDKRKVKAKSEEIIEIKQSKEYKERRENKFELVAKEERIFRAERQNALLSGEETEEAQFSDLIFIGVEEYGKRYTMKFSELNQHALIDGTTGSGKTTLLMIFVDHAIRNKIPIFYIDGKGAKDTLNSIRTIASKHKKKVKVFSDTENVRYNPIKHGNSVMIRDRLVTLAETESVFYSAAAKSLLQSTVLLLDTFQLSRTLANLSEYFSPRKVLMLFLNEEVKKKEKLLFVKQKKKIQKRKEVQEEEGEQQRKKTKLQKLSEDLQSDSKQELDVIVELKPEEMALEDLYWFIRSHCDLLEEKQRELFQKLFMRYDHKDSPFYLYATAESLQTNINMLLDSELGDLFNTEEEGIEELDLLEDSKNQEIMFITLNGLVYKDYIKTLAQFFVSEINYLASECYGKDEFSPFLLICDEPSVYINKDFLDTVNKGRGAGLHTIFSPQMIADISAVDEILAEQLLGNCNTYFIGQTNASKEIDVWSSLIGTYNDTEKTSVIEQEAGYSDLEKTDWVASRGTMRNVRNFVVHPDDIRDIRQGEFVVYRKSGSIREQARKVYVANPAGRSQKEAKRNE
ncbi:hypothetical protein IGI96_002995 [Enterococcus sp. DIV0421]|uniref:TraM recognition domain-containing protein n=1 Tax=Enterococcus sp. DIV0421 TaxID=2774688 RepID=UPI003F26D1B5